jgi:hypothetical protein
MRMRRAEVNSVVISVISFVGVAASSFYVANIAPYLLGGLGGILHVIASHETGVKFTKWKVIKMLFVSMVAGAGGSILAETLGMTQFIKVFIFAGGFLGWEILLLGYEKKDSLTSAIFKKIPGVSSMETKDTEKKNDRNAK